MAWPPPRARKGGHGHTVRAPPQCAFSGGPTRPVAAEAAPLRTPDTPGCCTLVLVDGIERASALQCMQWMFSEAYVSLVQ